MRGRGQLRYLCIFLDGLPVLADITAAGDERVVDAPLCQYLGDVQMGGAVHRITGHLHNNNHNKSNNNDYKYGEHINVRIRQELCDETTSRTTSCKQMYVGVQLLCLAVVLTMWSPGLR